MSGIGEASCGVWLRKKRQPQKARKHKAHELAHQIPFVTFVFLCLCGCLLAWDSGRAGRPSYSAKRIAHSTLCGIAVIVLALTSCDALSSMSGGVPRGAFGYVGTCDGNPCVTGWLKFSQTTPSNDIRGTWHLEKKGDTEFKLGPQIGEGEFRGSIDGKGVLDIDLNPGTSDNNVLLKGSFEGKPFESKIQGTWGYSTFIGVTTRGTFTAEKGSSP